MTPIPNLPQHVVIVPDGNRRWAKKKGRPSFMGHREGAKAMEKVTKAALELKIPCLTIWGASVSNVTERSEGEIRFLYKIFETYFGKLLNGKDIEKNEVRVNMLGRWEEVFPDPLKKVMRELVRKTESHTRHQLTFLMAYSGVEEMTAAVQSIAEAVRKNPELEVSQETVKEHLSTRHLPPVDLVIRTGGEPHWSAGMLMWDVAEARLHFTKTFWPDFSPKDFKVAVDEFSETERRFGR